MVYLLSNALNSERLEHKTAYCGDPFIKGRLLQYIKPVRMRYKLHIHL